MSEEVLITADEVTLGRRDAGRIAVTVSTVGARGPSGDDGPAGPAGPSGAGGTVDPVRVVIPTNQSSLIGITRNWFGVTLNNGDRVLLPSQTVSPWVYLVSGASGVTCNLIISPELIDDGGIVAVSEGNNLAQGFTYVYRAGTFTANGVQNDIVLAQYGGKYSIGVDQTAGGLDRQNHMWTYGPQTLAAGATNQTILTFDCAAFSFASGILTLSPIIDVIWGANLDAGTFTYQCNGFASLTATTKLYAQGSPQGLGDNTRIPMTWTAVGSTFVLKASNQYPGGATAGVVTIDLGWRLRA